MSCIRICNSRHAYSPALEENCRSRKEPAGQIDFRDADNCLIANSAKSLFAVTNQLLRMALLRNILDTTEHANRPVVMIKHHPSDRLDNANGPIRTQDSERAFIGLVVHERLHNPVLDSGSVVGVDTRHDLVMGEPRACGSKPKIRYCSSDHCTLLLEMFQFQLPTLARR